MVDEMTGPGFGARLEDRLGAPLGGRLTAEARTR